MVLSSVLKPDQSTRMFRKFLIIQSLHKDPVRTIQFSSLGPARFHSVPHGLARSCTIPHGLTRSHPKALSLAQNHPTRQHPETKRSRRTTATAPNRGKRCRCGKIIVPKTATTQPTAASRQNGLSARGHSQP